MKPKMFDLLGSKKPGLLLVNLVFLCFSPMFFKIFKNKQKPQENPRGNFQENRFQNCKEWFDPGLFARSIFVSTETTVCGGKIFFVAPKCTNAIELPGLEQNSGAFLVILYFDK